MVDFSTYQPPGVYIEEDLTSLVSVIGVSPTVVAIVGPSIGHRVNTEAIVLTGTDPVTLSRLGIDQASIAVRAVDGTVYDLNGDYVVTTTQGADNDPLTEADNEISIARAETASDITDGEVVYVAYEHTDADYYAPLRARDFDDVQDAFGPALNIEDGSIASPLSFAAKIAFENGADELVLISTTGAVDATVTRAELTAAYQKLESIYDVNVVVPLSQGIVGNVAEPGDSFGVGSDVASHINKMRTASVFRTAIIGFDKDSTIDPVAGADAINNERVVLAWPNRLHYYHGYTNTTFEVDGYYLAAAYAGRLASQPVQTPLTKKQIVGFSGLPASVMRSMTMSARNAWSEGGVAVTEVMRSGRMSVRHGVTTNGTNIYTRELSLVRARDALVSLMQQTVESSPLVGSYIDEDTPMSIKGVISGVLETAKQNEVIIDYTELKIRQLAGDPSVMEVKFQYKPAYPLNYIVIVFSVDTSTGQTTLAEAA